MYHEPNLIHWPRGAVIIHDADSKEPKQLMRIVGYTREGLAKCQYVDKRQKRKIYVNEFKYLHDPKRFNLNPNWGDHAQEHIERVQLAFMDVERWNRLHPIGRRVKTTSGDGGFETVTISKAYQDVDNGDAYIRLERGGLWLLKFVEAIVR